MIVLRYVLLGLAVCLLVGLGWRLTSVSPRAGRLPPVAAGPPQSPKADQLAAARKLVQNRLADLPEFAAFYHELESDFPHTYEHTVEGFSQRLAETGTLPTADALFIETLRALEQSQGVLAARASGQQLAAFFDARLALLDALAPGDPKQCADLLYGAADLPLADFTAAHRDLMANLARKQLAAMKDGQGRPSERQTPTAADFDLIASGLSAKKLSPDEISVLLDGKAVDPPLPDVRLCDMGRIYLNVLRALPDDARQRVYGLAAELLARS